MKALQILFLSLFCFTTVLAQSKKDIQKDDEAEKISISRYKPIYLITGNSDDQVRGQVSLKYDLFSSYKTNLFLGYSQYMDWRVYDDSSPFRNIDFNPEVFWRYDLNFIPTFLQFGFYEHRSNGEAGSKNRSVDSSYVSTNSTFNVWRMRFNWSAKFYHMYNIAGHNKDIYDYAGWWDTEISVGLYSLFKGYIDSEEFEFRLLPRGNSLNDSTRVYGLKFRTLLPGFQPKFYLQIWDGYYQTLLDYNRRDTAVRFGLIF